MNAKVVDFLNESGGSNLMESAPRPPTYGEENELHSNSSKGSSSHKSNKSQSSNRSATSTRAEQAHSPASTPRKSNLDSSTATGISNSSACENSEVAAPLGFEPEGSAANSPPYSENGTPPHVKWAESLNSLLADPEGVVLFREFMDSELAGGSEGLLFWFACQGFKRKVSCWDSSLESMKNLQKAIYKRYIRSDKVKCISKRVKIEIAEKVTSRGCPDPCIFNAAQDEVENFLRSETYPLFFQSHNYLEYVQNYVDSPKSSHSSGSNSIRPVSHTGLLPVVHEDKELEEQDFKFSMALPATSKVPSLCAKRIDVPSSVRHAEKRIDVPSSVRHAETITGTILYQPRTSHYPTYVSYAPVSAQDSELQSLSSDALTDDTVSVTDSSIDGYSQHQATKKHNRKSVMRTLASHNRVFRTGLHSTIPWSEHTPKDSILAESDPKQFAQLVIDKLSRVIEEWGSMAKMEEKLRTIHVVSETAADKADSEGKHINNKPSSSFLPLSSSSCMEEETAESILDQHCSRIWDSSIQHTPSYSPHAPPSPPHLSASHAPRSPPHLSPDVHSHKKPTTTVPAPVSTPAMYLARGAPHRKRDLVSYDLEEFLCGAETHRHIHHHHHHHHSSRDDSFKKTHMELESQTCGLVSWKSENTSSVDYAGRGGRASTRKNANNVGRRSLETCSNVDSGISVMDSVKVVANNNNWANTSSGSRVMKWILDSSEKTMIQEVSLQETDTSSSTHRRSHKLNQSAGSSHQTRTSSSKSKAGIRSTSTSVERAAAAGGGGVLSPWTGGTVVMPSQPFAQDPSMPLPTPPNPTTQLEEAKRRLQTRQQARGPVGQPGFSPVKSKSFTVGASTAARDKLRPPPPPSSSSSGIVVSVSTSTSHNYTLPAAARTMPHTHLNNTTISPTSLTGNVFSSQAGQQRAPVGPALQSSSSDTIIGMYMGQEPIPYRHQLPGKAITLAQIKTLLTKRGHFKFYFKSHSEEFSDGAGAVFEEIRDDNTIVPLWQGKIVVKVEKLDL